MATDDRCQFPADSITARDLRDFLVALQTTPVQPCDFYAGIDRESLRYICERCRTTKGTMFISKLGHCVCVDCSLVPADPQTNEGTD